MSQKQHLSIFSVPKVPPLSGLTKRRIFVGIRPFRKGGIRLEIEQTHGKNFIHNYGHGGAGISLAPVSALQVAQMLDKVALKNKEVAVLGSGIMGLLSALQSAKKGYKVTVYADRIPNPSTENTLEYCTSEISPGYWLPYYYDIPNLQQHVKRSKRAYSYYKQKFQTSPNLFYSQCFEDMSLTEFKRVNIEELNETAEEGEFRFGSKAIKGVKFRTFQINTPGFLQELMSECKQLGVKFQQLKLQSFEHIISSIRQENIVTCLAVASRYLLNDPNVYGLRGHLIEFENNFGISGVLGADHHKTTFYIFRNRMLIGMSEEKTEAKEVNREITKTIEKRALKIYKQIANQVKPKL